MFVQSVRAIAAALLASGIDAVPVLRRAGIDPARLADPDGRVELDHAWAFFDCAREASGDPHFGLHAATRIPAGSMEAIEYAVRSCATLGDAIAQLARYYAVVDDRAAIHIERAPGVVSVVYSPPAQRDPPRTAKEFLFAYMLERGSNFVGSRIHVVEVRWRHAEPPAPEVARAFFDAPVSYGAPRDELVLPLAAIEAPMIAPDPLLSSVLGRVLEQMCAGLETKDLLADVKSCIGGMLSRGAPSVDDVARALATSGRTLQRRLRENHTSFSELVAGVQRELSLAYLRDPSLSVGEVAYLVGFADATSFHRAFRRWTGETPAAMRRPR